MKEQFKLIRSKSRFKERGRHSKKHMGDDFRLIYSTAAAKGCDFFGHQYTIKILKDEDALPTIRQVLEGLHLHYVNLI